MGAVLLLSAGILCSGPSALERWIGLPLTCDACRPGGGYIFCQTCRGKGLVADPCPRCEGRGQIPCRRCTAQRPADWPAAVPNGMMPCTYCRGSGTMRKLVHGAGAPAVSWFEDRPCEFCARACGWVNCKVCHGKGSESCRKTAGPPHACDTCGGAGKAACPACAARLARVLTWRIGLILAALLEPPPASPPAQILEGEASAGRLLPPARQEPRPSRAR